MRVVDTCSSSSMHCPAQSGDTSQFEVLQVEKDLGRGRVVLKPCRNKWTRLFSGIYCITF